MEIAQEEERSELSLEWQGREGMREGRGRGGMGPSGLSQLSLGEREDEDDWSAVRS